MTIKGDIVTCDFCKKESHTFTKNIDSVTRKKELISKGWACNSFMRKTLHICSVCNDDGE